jgi:uncharacterized membrane protein
MSETTTSDESKSPLICAACRALDAQDGAADGQLFTANAKYHVRDESHIWQSIKDTQDRVADTVTDFAGSLKFVYMHSVWFFIWVLINVGILGGAAKFDPFPFGLLTMIVSLEAIFLSTFVMVSQNRQSARSDLRAELDFETNLRAEIWAMHIGAQLGIDHEHVEAIVSQAIAASKATPAKSPAG